MAIAQNGVYHFTNKAYGGALTVHTVSTPSSGTNVCLHPINTADNVQKWRAVYASVSAAGKKLYWLNTESGGTYSNFALDRFTGSSNPGNADVYQSSRTDCSAADQLVYFDDDQAPLVKIILFSNGHYLTGSTGTNGNVYWTNSNLGTAQQWNVTEVIAGTAAPSITAEFKEKHYYINANNSSYPLFVGECVWYCLGRVYEKTGKKCTVGGNAKDWVTSARAQGLTVSTTPKANSVACFGGGTYGHVAFVESVSGTTIEYTDANFYSGTRLSNGQLKANPIGVDGLKRSISQSKFERMYGAFLGYIYF